jgi:hypothetical protein
MANPRRVRDYDKIFSLLMNRPVICEIFLRCGKKGLKPSRPAGRAVSLDDGPSGTVPGGGWLPVELIEHTHHIEGYRAAAIECDAVGQLKGFCKRHASAAVGGVGGVPAADQLN